MAKVFLLILYLGVSLYGLYKLKSAAVGLNVDYVGGFLAYGVGLLLWLFVIRLYPLSVAFPLAAGSLICGTQLVGFFILKEEFTAAKATGVGLLLAGLVLLAVAELTRSDG